MNKSSVVHSVNFTQIVFLRYCFSHESSQIKLFQTMDKTLLFLINLAWESRYKLPLLITVGFMVLDIRMQLEITVESRRIRRARAAPFQEPGPNGQRDFPHPARANADEDDASEGRSYSYAANLTVSSDSTYKHQI